MRKLITHITLTFLTILLVSFSYADDVSFVAKTSHSVVKTGDQFKVEFTTNTSINNFSAPDFSNFKVISGPNQSTSMQWVNGNRSSSISISYVLIAIKEGNFTIGPATATAGNTNIQTNSLSISVKKGANVSQQNSQPNKSTSKPNTENLYIKASVSKTKVYMGEQIIATYKLYTKVNIAANELIKSADLNGFWNQEIDLGQHQWRQEVIGGYRWNVATIRKTVLLPQHTGNLEIDPLEMSFTVQERSEPRTFAEQFFGGHIKNVEYKIKSKSIKIKVLPHPTPPEGFDGAVGNLNMVVDISTKEVKANEAVNIKVKISGKGNIPLIDNLAVNFPSDFETYDPKISDNIKTTENGISGSREFDYLVIPRHAGEFKLDPISFTYFNPSTKKYKTIVSDPIIINVAKGEENTNNVTFSGVNKEDIEILGEDIRFIHTGNTEISHTNSSFYNNWLFYFSLLVAPLLFVIVFIFKNKIREAQNDIVGSKNKKANKVANKFLASAKKELTGNDKNAFYDAISNALFGYASDKLNISSSDLNREHIKEKLTSRNISSATINKFIDTIDLCEMARFSPISVSDQEVYNKAETTITKIEEEFKG